MRTSSRSSGWLLLGMVPLAISAAGLAFAESDSANGTASASQPAEVTTLSCPADMILGTGPADEAILSAEASVGVRAFWCERYDAFGRTERLGPYREVYANGQIRLEATYVKAGAGMRLEGPVEIRNEDGSPFLKGFLKQGEWDGPFEIFYEQALPAAPAEKPQPKLTQKTRSRPKSTSKTNDLDQIWPIGPSTPSAPENPLGPAASESVQDAPLQTGSDASPAANPDQELSAAN